VALACVAATIVIAGCGGSGGTTSEANHHAAGTTTSAGLSPSEHRAATRRLAKRLGVSRSRIKRLQGGHGFAATGVRPAEIVPGGPGPFFSSDVISPIENGWQAADRRTFTAVDAGVNPADRSMGELGIFRQNFVKATQNQDVVNVPGAGALRITHAPLGRSVVTWAQRRGNLDFVGKRGVSGTLHLSDDKVTIHGGR
jgi:hypothetical protein